VDATQAERWIRAVKEHAQYFDISKRYEKIKQIGAGKFSTVHLVRAVEGRLLEDDTGDELLAMKQLDKKKLTRKEREFLRDEI
jgi:serine/threonine protein kinase